MKSLRLISVCLLLVLVSFGVTSAQDQTIAETVISSASGDTPEFATLLAAVQAADPAVLELLSDPEANITVFAPTDEAFDRLRRDLGDDEFDALLADQARLTEILLYHVVPDFVRAADILTSVPTYNERALLPTLQGQHLDIFTDGLYYVDVDEAAVQVLNIPASNGIIHQIDQVLLPEQRTMGEVLVEQASSGGLFSRSEFTKLLEAFETAPPILLEVMNDPNASFTLFAPTDAAFDRLRDELGGEEYDALMEDPAAIGSILLNHALQGRNYTQGVDQMLAAAILAGEGEIMVPTLLPNSSFSINVASNGGLVLNDNVRITTRDFDLANGVVHVIDNVLVPSENTIVTSEEVIIELAATVLIFPEPSE